MKLTRNCETASENIWKNNCNYYYKEFDLGYISQFVACGAKGKKRLIMTLKQIK